MKFTKVYNFIGGKYQKANVGVIGLGVMGYGFAMNFEENRYIVAVTNWEKDILENVAASNPDKDLIISENLSDFVQNIENLGKYSCL